MESDKLHDIRHSLAHLLAIAVLRHDPKAKLAIGPVIDNGFYYDFLLSKPLSETDLPTLEKEMRRLAEKNLDFIGREISKADALKMFANQPFKLELIDELSKEGSKLTVYTTGDFTDLCRGGHVRNTSEIPADAFKLEKVAGAYWRGDEKKQMLTRIYGLAFESKDELDSYIAAQAEAAKRDHRKLGKELDLFTFSELVGPGLPLWTPKGHLLREALTDKLWSLSKKYDYQKVTIPHIAKIDLYEKSGHAAKFKDEFFYVRGAQSNDEFVFKPMNCPHHTQIYASRPRSYRDLPLRLNELTMMYRDEKPGQLLGLTRVRSISIDDAHIFCTPDQIKDEVRIIVKIIKEFYTSLDMYRKGETFWVSLSVRDPKTPEKYLGKDENWNKAEQYLQEISDEFGLDAVRKEGEAAFYGPKLDFMFKDALGRERQLATAQIDFVQPERFGLEYVSPDGKKETPVMVHRAVAGSLERFIAIMIEHFAGAFPTWLSPAQAVVIPVSEKFNDYATEIYKKLKEEDIRAEFDSDNDTLGKKIRNNKLKKTPYLIVIGAKEAESGTITVESRDKGQMKDLKVEDFADLIRTEISGR